MYLAPFEVAIFNLPPPEVTGYDVEIFRALLEALVTVNVIELRHDPSIPLFHDAVRQGLVRYVPPERQRGLTRDGDDPWRCIVSSIVAREVDCEDAVAWRVAELRQVFGVAARPVFRVGMHPDGQRRMVHVLVGLPNGETEDPSRRAGM